MSGTVPDRIIIQMLKIGVAAVKTDLGEIDDILASLDAAELAKVKANFVDETPYVVQGFPSQDQPFPLFAVTLGSDSDHTEFIGEGEQAVFDILDTDLKIGDERNRRRRDSFMVYIYARHPDICAYLYRIAKRIAEVGVGYMEARGLQLPAIQGRDLVPEQKDPTTPLFVRSLSISVEYHDEWPAQGTLWVALNGEAEPFIDSESGKIAAYREDVHFTDDDGDDISGTIKTF